MTLGSHITPLSRNYIETADVVFAATSDGIVELWLAKMHPDVRSLQSFYHEGKSRAETYRQMVAAMLAEVRAGKRVCGAFYGHPGVFAGVGGAVCTGKRLRILHHERRLLYGAGRHPQGHPEKTGE